MALILVKNRPFLALALTAAQIDHLKYIHDQNYIHGDIKPSNILIGPGDRRNNVYIIDFGLAKEFCTGVKKKRTSIRR